MADDKKKQDAAGKDKTSSSPEEEVKGGRLSRLRFKKKDMPGGLWLKCPECATTIYRKELEEKGSVCPACNFHFTLAGRKRIETTLDPGSWKEEFTGLTTLDRLGFTDNIPYGEKVAKAVAKTGQNEAMIVGTGKVLGRPIVIGVLDFQFLGGSMGEVVGEKISLAAELARREKHPLVLFTSSGGARMHEGMLSLMQMAKTCSALADLSDAGGYSICVLTNPTTGGVTASFASVCDLTLAEPGALIGFAGPRVIASTIKQELPPGFQKAEFLVQKGQLDAIVDRARMPETLALLIDYGTTEWNGYGPFERSSSAEGDGEGKSSEESGPDEQPKAKSSSKDASARGGEPQAKRSGKTQAKGSGKAQAKRSGKAPAERSGKTQAERSENPRASR